MLQFMRINVELTKLYYKLVVQVKVIDLHNPQ
jgi:hypothetical protein